jgi:hypothetical protein
MVGGSATRHSHRNGEAARWVWENGSRLRVCGLIAGSHLKARYPAKKGLEMVEGQKSEHTENLGSHGGRASSWLAVTVILLGVVVAGYALTADNWTLVWIGAGVSVVGGILALVFDIFTDVVIDAPRAGLRAEDHR